jgi:[acyl-carrier-protein] S-malonyltransferase
MDGGVIMAKGFLFAGQGAQYLEMGRDLYETSDVFASTIDDASDVLGYDLRALIDGQADKLNQTRYTQPAILATSVGILRVLADKGLTPDIVAGLSLGEYSALVASGALDFRDAVALVAKRGQYMEEAAPAGSGKMVAVLNADLSTIEDAIAAVEDGIVSIANYNTPAQLVIGGEVSAVDTAVENLKAAGVKRLIPLNVSGPFHTALLEPASRQLAEALEDVDFADFVVPLVSNTTAQVMPQADIKDLLTQQVMKPVRFYESIATMQAAGVDHFIEIGPGKVLSGFMKKIDKTARVDHVENAETLAALFEEVVN